MRAKYGRQNVGSDHNLFLFRGPSFEVLLDKVALAGVAAWETKSVKNMLKTLEMSD